MYVQITCRLTANKYRGLKAISSNIPVPENCCFLEKQSNNTCVRARERLRTILPRKTYLNFTARHLFAQRANNRWSRCLCKYRSSNLICSSHNVTAETFYGLNNCDFENNPHPYVTSTPSCWKVMRWCNFLCAFWKRAKERPKSESSWATTRAGRYFSSFSFGASLPTNYRHFVNGVLFTCTQSCVRAKKTPTGEQKNYLCTRCAPPDPWMHSV